VWKGDGHGWGVCALSDPETAIRHPPSIVNDVYCYAPSYPLLTPTPGATPVSPLPCASSSPPPPTPFPQVCVRPEVRLPWAVWLAQQAGAAAVGAGPPVEGFKRLEVRNHRGGGRGGGRRGHGEMNERRGEGRGKWQGR
jgi:hypothetical protein